MFYISRLGNTWQSTWSREVIIIISNWVAISSLSLSLSLSLEVDFLLPRLGQGRGFDWWVAFICINFHAHSLMIGCRPRQRCSWFSRQLIEVNGAAGREGEEGRGGDVWVAWAKRRQQMTIGWTTLANDEAPSAVTSMEAIDQINDAAKDATPTDQKRFAMRLHSTIPFYFSIKTK